MVHKNEIFVFFSVCLSLPFPSVTLTLTSVAHHHALLPVQAKLAKNYGLLKMDPFVRLVVGPCVKRTKICEKGGTHPRWSQAVTV